jgi:hypothetical protein
MGHGFVRSAAAARQRADEWFSILPDGVMEPICADSGLSYASRA